VCVSTTEFHRVLQPRFVQKLKPSCSKNGIVIRKWDTPWMQNGVRYAVFCHPYIRKKTWCRKIPWQTGMDVQKWGIPRMPFLVPRFLCHLFIRKSRPFQKMSEANNPKVGHGAKMRIWLRLCFCGFHMYSSRVSCPLHKANGTWKYWPASVPFLIYRTPPLALRQPEGAS